MPVAEIKRIDWVVLLSVLLIGSAGLVTMKSFTGESGFFERQIIWALVSVVVFFIVSSLDGRIFKRSDILLYIYSASIFLLISVYIIGKTVHGAQSWLSLGAFSFQPSDLVKLVLILILAKYFSRRHVAIRHPKHLLISGLYAFIPFLLVFLEPDFGSAIVIFLIWFGMTLVSGISKKHLFTVFFTALIAFGGLWFFVFQNYQKERIINFLNPSYDVSGSGYNALQSRIAVGSGGLFGKGLGYGTQSRLRYLPEYQTDFIFAAYAEEWGFVGALFLLILYGLLLSRVLKTALRGATNFETLFGVGLAIFLLAHLLINIGMNIGILPITGITLPFMSYGGSHLVVEFLGLGILMSMRRYARVAHREDLTKEFVGI